MLTLLYGSMVLFCLESGHKIVWTDFDGIFFTYGLEQMCESKNQLYPVPCKYKMEANTDKVLCE
jgi:hypothetical protein